MPQDHRGAPCQCALASKSPWMSVRRRRTRGQVTWAAAHLPLTRAATPQETNKHKAMKERIARTAARHGLDVETEARSSDGRVITGVLVTGAGARVGWEAQYSTITANTVRRRSAKARELENALRAASAPAPLPGPEPAAGGRQPGALGWRGVVAERRRARAPATHRTGPPAPGRPRPDGARRQRRTPGRRWRTRQQERARAADRQNAVGKTGAGVTGPGRTRNTSRPGTGQDTKG